ncbi:MAG: YlmC/YmxH family sporulation protein [Clostridiales bacterium]|nr:YlmC/YmxH family sporulation protein [Clostridiales bacterium]
MSHKKCFTTFTDLRRKDVINVCDGVKLGRVCDLELDVDACPAQLVAIIVPGPARLFGIIRSEEELVVPYPCIQKIGDDVILVDIPPKKI